MINFGVLWMNARNLIYIKPYNSKRSIKLADSKIRTKFFLNEMDIPVPDTITVFETHKQLFSYDWDQLLWKVFVVKPNKWAKWKWIFICYMESKDSIKVNWEYIWLQTFLKYVLDVLNGKYSMKYWGDFVIVEEKVIPWDKFIGFCEFWLADIRIITFNLIPVIAMLRYPTKRSKGKANIYQWWIWFWIEIGTWKIYSMYDWHKIYQNTFPDEYKHFKWKTIPFWDDILLYSSQIQYFTNIWYLALDWVITDKAPKILEINARAWLEIQLATWISLESRLHKIKDIKIDIPSKWVEISKSLFTLQKVNPIIAKKIIYLSQPGEIKFWNTVINVVVKVDMTKKSSFIWQYLHTKISENAFTLGIWDCIFSDLDIKLSKEIWPNVIYLWRNHLGNCLIQPIEKYVKNYVVWKQWVWREWEEMVLEQLDIELHQLWKKINLSKILKPLNYMTELENFVLWYGNYNPKFEYKFISDWITAKIQTEILKIEDKYFSKDTENKSKLFALFKEKFEEIKIKFELMKVYKKQDFGQILEYNEKMYWNISEDNLKLCKEKVLLWLDKQNFKSGNVITPNEVVQRIKEYLKTKNIKWVRVLISNNIYSRIIVRRWIPVEVIVSWNDVFQTFEIEMIIAHEIDVHLIRYLNWHQNWWKILESGTWFYLADEEGLAVYNSLKYLPEWYQKTWMYERYFLVSQAWKQDFKMLADIIRWFDPKRSLAKVFNLVLRVKKWVVNTSFIQPWAIYMKDKVYLDWYTKICDYLKTQDLDMELFKSGKIKIEDIEYIS